ncbi:MAG: HEAT repeat domain-containing protein [Planctomycetaceae bacterium]|nr:HEAT repeat domain-containing protein [Planctomycetaceae bacterium]
MTRHTDPSGTIPAAGPAPSEEGVGYRPPTSQLYFLALLGAALLVAFWLVFSWALPVERDPQTLVRGMRGPSHENWQKAHTLAELLRSPHHAALRADAALCRELASILDEQFRTEQFRAAPDDPVQTRFRVYLCRALGEFRVPDGLPSLLQAAEVSAHSGCPEVQCAALEALAVLASNVGPSAFQNDPRALSVLRDASGPGQDAGESDGSARIASTATFTLGVVGGPAATQRLTELLADRRPNVRYNAATGLARHGEMAALPVLLEMLDADNFLSLDGPSDAGAPTHYRELVTHNAVRAITRLAPVVPPEDGNALSEALARLHNAPALPARLRLAVEAAQIELHAAHGSPRGSAGGL